MTIPYITIKQQEIIKLLYKFRFLNTKQIQKFLHHKDKKTINVWLRDLRKKEYVIWDFDPHTFGENAKPAIYRLGINGIRFLKTQDVEITLLRKLYRERQRSEEFISHSLFLADIVLNVSEATTKQDSFTFYTQSDYFSPKSPYALLQELSPDLYLTRRTGQGKTKQYLLHDIPESMLRFRSFKLRKKIRDYIAYFFTNEWENETKTNFPTLLFILPDMAALINLQRYTQTILNNNDNPKIEIWLQTKAKIQKLGFTGTPWEEVE